MQFFILLCALCFANKTLFAGLVPRYHTLNEIRQEILTVQNTFPQNVKVDTLAYSTKDNLPIWLIKVSSNPSQNIDKPAILIVGSHHAEEVLGVEALLWTLNDLMTRFSQNDSLANLWVNSLEIFFVPTINPDGFRYVTESQTFSQVTGIPDSILVRVRKNLVDTNLNGVFDAVHDGIDLRADGIDLNRNYNLQWSLVTSDSMSPYFKGLAPFSENETQVIKNLTEQEKFIVAIFFHSSRSGENEEKIFFPWNVSGTLCPDYLALYSVADSMRVKFPRDSGIGFYSIVPTSSLASLGGKARSWVYAEHGTFGYEVEIGSKIQPTSTTAIDSLCEKSKKAVYEIFERSQYGIIKVNVKDSVLNQPIVATIKVTNLINDFLNLVKDRKTEQTFGSFYKVLLADSTYNFEISKTGYFTQTFTGVTVSSDSILELNVSLLPNATEEESNETPETFKLLGNFPNPFNPITKISYFLPQKSFVKIRIFDVLGKEIRFFKSQQMPSGYHTLIWNGTNNHKKQVSSGVYFYSFEVSEPNKEIINKVGKMTLLK